MKEGTEVKMWCAYCIIKGKKFYEHMSLRYTRKACREFVRNDLKVEKVTVTIRQKI